MSVQKTTEEVENVRVIARIRPISKKEQDNKCNIVVSAETGINGCIFVTNPNSNSSQRVIPKNFYFDVVFGTESKQLDVYNEIARPVVDKVLAGYNGTIFAYGQTGTGKTFTMEGSNTVAELRGIIPNSFAHIFGHIAKAQDDTKFLVRVSYFEIYNEEIHDLLSKKGRVNLEVKERPDVGVYVKDLSTFIVNNADDMERIMATGNKKRIIGSTAMNTESSRSHAIFSITIETSKILPAGDTCRNRVKVGRLHLVDLAGSERQSKTETSGLRLKEATKINLSLSTLGNVISALVDGKSTHIPYRNSKLTRILQDSLGGNSKTVMCATISPVDYNYDETISTLRYASRAKSITNKAYINEDPKDALLRQFQKEIELLRKQLDESSNAEESDNEEKKQQLSSNHNQSDMMLKSMSASIQFANDVTTQQDIELKNAQSETEQLRRKLESLEKKIIIGGENLLEKAETQERLLQLAAKELQERKDKEEHLSKQIELKQSEQLDTEEKYTSLQEEIAALAKKTKKTSSMITCAKEELKDIYHENQREMEGLLEHIRQLNKDLTLYETLQKMYIPHDYAQLIEQHVQWNEDIDEWELKCVAYTGNNMNNTLPQPMNRHLPRIPPVDISNSYLTYSSSCSRSRVQPSKTKIKDK